jgi:two-component system LytT family response regulator
MKAIIIDDEYSAREVLHELLKRHCPEIEVSTTCEDVISGVEAIKLHQPDLVFLDVKMPDYNGYEIIDFFEEIPFKIIFITAYDKYALKAFEISATDYLLKPLEIERLKIAVQKASDQILIKQDLAELKKLAENLKESNQKYTYSDKGLTHYFMVADIIAIEAQRSYSTFKLTNGKQITVSKNIKAIHAELADSNKFFRTHRSWIVNLEHVISYSKSAMHITLSEAVIARLSRPYKVGFEQKSQTYAK